MSTTPLGPVFGADVAAVRFTCPACRQPVDADRDMMRRDIDCPNCGRKVRVPLHVFPANPYRRPMCRLLAKISEIQWCFPFLLQLIQFTVLLLVSVVTMVLYLTVGIASQVEAILRSLMLEAKDEFKSGGLIEKSAYAVAVLIYVVLWVPFWLLVLPFLLLGWIWNRFGQVGLILLTLLVAAGLAFVFRL